jgi:hypothetical protein
MKTFLQCCGSGMFIPDPDFYPSRIPDPNTASIERDEKNIWANFQRIIELLPKKLALSSQKYGVVIPDTGVNDS